MPRINASVWADEYTLKVFQLLLNYTLHPKPKVQQTHHTKRQVLLSHDNQELRPRWEGTEYPFLLNETDQVFHSLEKPFLKAPEYLPLLSKYALLEDISVGFCHPKMNYSCSIEGTLLEYYSVGFPSPMREVVISCATRVHSLLVPTLKQCVL